jgi:hypothetical protein
MSNWKGAERRVAAALHGQRIPVTGIDRDGADVVTAAFHVQVKHRKSLPIWLWRWLDGIRGTATVEGKTGVLVLSRPGQRQSEALVVMSFSDFEAWHGRMSDDGKA